MNPVLLDAGPLVALVLKSEAMHGWASEQLKRIANPPLLTCEAVITEASFILQRERRDPTDLMKLACAGLFEVRFDFNREAPAILDLMTAYRDRPMSFADACLVRMAEQNPNAAVWTLDHDFQIYRKYRHEPIPLISPF